MSEEERLRELLTLKNREIEALEKQIRDLDEPSDTQKRWRSLVSKGAERTEAETAELTDIGNELFPHDSAFDEFIELLVKNRLREKSEKACRGCSGTGQIMIVTTYPVPDDTPKVKCPLCDGTGVR